MTTGNLIFKSLTAERRRPAPTATEKGAVAAQYESYSVAVNPTANDVVALCVLPANHVPVDIILDTDDLDASTGVTISVGVVNKTPDELLTATTADISTATADGGAVWIASSAAAQTGVIARPTTKAFLRVTPSATDRIIGLQFTAAASGTFSAGRVGLCFFYRPATFGV